MSQLSADQWKESIYKEHVSIVGENECIRVEIVPDRGSKLISFKNVQTGKEWVYRNEEPWFPLDYGMRWEDGDRSGWDEMFPTILACLCPDDPWRGISYPDHGEVWTLPWRYELNGDSVRMWVNGVKVPYIFSKTYSISGKELQIRYEVQNPTPFAISYMWCAHFLLEIRQGMKLAVDPKLNSVQYQYTHNNRMTPKPYGRSSYPIAQVQQASVYLSVIEDNLGRHAEKYWFEGELRQGFAGISDSETGDALTYLFSPEDVPYLAVWANYGVFTHDYTFAFEPSTGFLDDVYMANVMQKVKKVEPYSSNQWDFVVSVDPLRQQIVNQRA